MSATTTTTQAVASGASVTFGPLTTADGGGDNSGSSNSMAARGANYFFGFLITFVVLLLIFVGCGIGSRRRFLARRQEGMFAGLDPWGQPRQEEQKQPVFYEHPLGEPIIEDKWMYTTPLSMTLLRQPKDPQSADPTRDLENNDTNAHSGNDSTPHHHHVYPRHIAALITPFRERKRRMHDSSDTTEDGVPKALDIAVMIAMPSPEHPHYEMHGRRPSSSLSSTPQSRPTSSESARPALPDMQIGVAHIPWHTEIDSVS